MSPGCVATHRFARAQHGGLRLNPPRSPQPLPGSRLLHGVGVAEIRAARALHQVAAGGGHIADLRGRAGKESLGEDGKTLGPVGRPPVPFSADGAKARPPSADSQSCQVQSRDVDQLRRRLDIPLHQVDQLRAASEEGAAAAGGNLARRSGSSTFARTRRNPASSTSPAVGLRDRGPDVGVRAAAADVPAHEFATSSSVLAAPS